MGFWLGPGHCDALASLEFQDLTEPVELNEDEEHRRYDCRYESLWHVSRSMQMYANFVCCSHPRKSSHVILRLLRDVCCMQELPDESRRPSWRTIVRCVSYFDMFNSTPFVSRRHLCLHKPKYTLNYASFAW